MKAKIVQVLERFLNKRDIVIWGNPTRLLLRTLKPYALRFDDDADPLRHYVVTVNEEDLRDFQSDEKSRAFRYVQDYFSFSDYGRCLPFEWDCYNAKIGRQTYFGEKILWSCGFGYIERIGQFTSINHSAAIYGNHQLNMTFTSDQLPMFFTNENKGLFWGKIQSDPNNPYGKHKGGIIIGNDVWIGANAFINASGVRRIGDGAVIGTGAVVLEDVPPYAVVAGAPGKILRYRFAPEKIETLLRVKWWDWTIEKINENADAMFSPELFFKRFGTPQG